MSSEWERLRDGLRRELAAPDREGHWLIRLTEKVKRIARAWEIKRRGSEYPLPKDPEHREYITEATEGAIRAELLAIRDRFQKEYTLTTRVTEKVAKKTLSEKSKAIRFLRNFRPKNLRAEEAASAPPDVVEAVSLPGPNTWSIAWQLGVLDEVEYFFLRAISKGYSSVWASEQLGWPPETGRSCVFHAKRKMAEATDLLQANRKLEALKPFLTQKKAEKKKRGRPRKVSTRRLRRALKVVLET